MKKVLLPILVLAMVLGVMLPVATPVLAGVNYDPSDKSMNIEAGVTDFFEITMYDLTPGEAYGLLLVGISGNKLPDEWINAPQTFTPTGTEYTVTIEIAVPSYVDPLTYGTKIKYHSSASGCTLYVTVTPAGSGPATSIVIAPDGESLVVGETLAYTATAHDDYDNSWDVTAETTFSSGAGSFTDDELTAENVGTWDVIGEYDSLSDTVSVTVEAHGLATSITVTPDGETLVVGETLGYAATADDGMGHTWDVTAETTFSSGAGSFTDDELTAENVGTWDVIGEYDSLSDTVSVTVEAQIIPEPGEPNIFVTPQRTTNPIGTTHTFTATVFDSDGNRVYNETILWTIVSGPGSLVTPSEIRTNNNGTANVTITSDEEGTTVIMAHAVGLDISGNAVKIWVDETESLFFTVDFTGEITQVPMAPDGRILAPMAAPSPDGLHLFEMAEGIRVLDSEGNFISLIEIRDPEGLTAEPGTIILTAFIIIPEGITFDGEVWITLGYEVATLPVDATTVEMAYYDITDEWVEIEAESDVVAGIGEMGTQIESSGTFGILAEIAALPLPAYFAGANLNIERSLSKTWEYFTFIIKAGEDATISVYVTNTGGQDGTYLATLKLNGTAIETKSVTISQGSGQQITFNITGNEPGTYSVEVGGLTGSFKSAVWINWWLIIGLISAFGLIIWSIWYFKFYKKKIKT